MGARPMSPFLTYRFAHTMVLSFAHRASGVALSIGLIVLTWWLAALGRGERAYETLVAVMSSWFGKLVLLAFLALCCYHLVNGIRHLTWDAGWGMEKAQTRRTAVVVVVATLLLFAALSYLLFCPVAVTP